MVVTVRQRERVILVGFGSSVFSQSVLGPLLRGGEVRFGGVR